MKQRLKHIRSIKYELVFENVKFQPNLGKKTQMHKLKNEKEEMREAAIKISKISISVDNYIPENRMAQKSQ